MRFVRAPLIAVAPNPQESEEPEFVAYVRVNRPLYEVTAYLNGRGIISESSVGMSAVADRRRCVQVPLSLEYGTPDDLMHAHEGTPVRFKLQVYGRNASVISTKVRLRRLPPDTPQATWFRALGCKQPEQSYAVGG